MDSDSAQHQKYDINSAREHNSIDFESASLQTVAAFAEFLRHSRGEGTPRLRTGSHPGIGFPCSQTRRLVLSGSFQLPEEFQVERAPLASPSSRATETRESASSVVVYERSPRRDRSFSTTESQFPRLYPATFREVLDNVREMSGVDQQDPDSSHARVARRLKELADEFEREHLQEYSRWETIFATVFGFPRPDVVQTFMRFVKEVQEDEFSWSFLIRFFFFGFKLLQGLSPTTNGMDEQQSELLDIFMNFLMDRLTTWIQSQGGWDCFPDVVHVCHSQSIPESSMAASTSGSQSSTVTPGPSLPVTVVHQNGASLLAQLPTANHSSASACSHSCLGASAGIGSTRLAASFGLALGSFLHNRR